jgi:hypothetical protein
MVRKGCLAVFAALVMISAASAQTGAWRFHWQNGQVLTYKVEQTLGAVEVTPEGKIETRTKVNLLKRWQVTAMDASGVATLQLSMSALRLETTTPAGDTLLFDSADPAASNPQMREQMSKYVGSVLAVLRIDGQGRVIEVKESKFGPASKYENELPFGVTLPESEARTGTVWDRTYKVTLEPPQGTGEKFDALQKCVVKGVNGKEATIGMVNAVLKLPDAVAEQVPLLQFQPEGEVVFDTQAGFMKAVGYHIDKELKGHQGQGSSYHFESSYSEVYAGSN